LTAEFPLKDYALPVCLSLKEVAEHAGRKVSMEVDNNSALIVSDPLGILVQQLRQHPIY
jgi:hypothetical protein